MCDASEKIKEETKEDNKSDVRVVDGTIVRFFSPEEQRMINEFEKEMAEYDRLAEISAAKSAGRLEAEKKYMAECAERKVEEMIELADRLIKIGDKIKKKREALKELEEEAEKGDKEFQFCVDDFTGIIAEYAKRFGAPENISSMEIESNGNDGYKMCEAIEGIKVKAKIEGIKEGIEKGRKEMIEVLRASGVSEELIQKALEKLEEKSGVK